MSRNTRRPDGEIRQSQLVTTFGPGAMVDLPRHSVLIGGLDDWQGETTTIVEDRLLGWLRDRLKNPELKLCAPPVDSSDAHAPRTGIPAYQFPGWFVGQVDEEWTSKDGRTYRTRPLIPFARLVKGGYLGRDRKVRPVVPVRFVQACVKGHISDIDWYAFVNRHGQGDRPVDRNGQLWLDEGGPGNDFAEIHVRLGDGENPLRRALSDAAVPGSKALGACKGYQPWLGPRVQETCDKHNRLLSRSASNAYFSQTMAVIAIPDGAQLLRDAVGQVYDPFLENCEGPDDVRYERKKAQVDAALEGFSNDEVWAEVERRRKGIAPPEKGIKEAELDTLLAQKDSLGEDRPEGDFFARNHPVGVLPAAAAGKVDRLVLVHRLREVVAQVGFTRFEAHLPGIDGELDLGVELAPLARELRWLPAYENRGEGVFLSLDAASIDAWLRREAVQARGGQLRGGFEAWRARKGVGAEFPGLPYIMLHSLAHLLITTVSLDCGYAASSIRERVYAGENGYGILLYTGSPGAEGTLGGLVDAGRNIGRHLERALELGRLCSNDPVCAQHNPSESHDERHLHGAACHGCVLIAETSCERRNELLDRALVVPTVETPDAAFFLEPG